jgi:protein-disulfide isomerase
MSLPPTRSKRKSSSPFVNLLIPLAFLLGLASGYLLWGFSSAQDAAADQIPRVKVSTDDDPSIGPEDAPVTIIEFGDYTCYYCSVWTQQVFKPLMAAYPTQVRFVFRDLPIIGVEAYPSAEAATCAGEQDAYWKYHDALFSGQYELSRTAYEQYATDLGLDLKAFTACLDENRYKAEAQADARDARNIGLNSTPSFAINGRLLIGAQTLEDFKAVIDEELAAKP